MSRQSGSDLKRLDAVSLREIDFDIIEDRYQDAVKWRYRIKNGTQHLADANKDIIMQHVDALIKACNLWRGRYLSGREK